MSVLCAFNPPIWLDLSYSVRPIYRNWLREKLFQFEKLNREELQLLAFQFWKHLVESSHFTRDLIWLILDNAFLEYFHSRNELLFKDRVFNVKKSHQDKYTLSVNTKFGNVTHQFSSIRECRDTTGLELRNHLRKILYK